MVSMTVGGRSSDGSETDSYLGTWWVPESGREPVGGSLTFDRKKGASLTIAGSLEGAFRFGYGEPIRYLTIFGATSGGTKFTIVNAHIVHRRAPLALEVEADEEAYGASTVLIGAHLPSGSQEGYEGFAFQTALLGEWAYGPRVQTTELTLRTHSLTMTTPEPLEASVGTSDLRLGWSGGESMSADGTVVHADPNWYVNFGSPALGVG